MSLGFNTIYIQRDLQIQFSITISLREYPIQLKPTSYFKGDSIRIDLNKEVEEESYYDLFFHDQKYFYINMNSEAGYPLVRKVVYPEQLPLYYPIALQRRKNPKLSG